jgi:hypothetical protein
MFQARQRIDVRLHLFENVQNNCCIQTEMQQITNL